MFANDLINLVEQKYNKIKLFKQILYKIIIMMILSKILNQKEQFFYKNHQKLEWIIFNQKDKFYQAKMNFYIYLPETEQVIKNQMNTNFISNSIVVLFDPSMQIGTFIKLTVLSIVNVCSG